jgi:LysM repeat protein
MRDKIETALTIVLTLILIAIPVWWLHDALYGDWQYVPMVEAAPEPPRPKTYQVMPGDSLWSIYVEHYKGCDWDEVRYKIGQANGLKNDRLYPYEVIKLPGVG